MEMAAGGSSDQNMGEEGEVYHRDNIFEFFRNHTAYDMLPESGKVILMDSSISAYSAYSLMAANEQQSVPVWDSRSDRYCGTLTTTDLVQLILLCAESKEHESCVQGMRDMDLDHFISNYSRPPWGEQQASLEVRPDDDLMSVLRTLIRSNCRVLPVVERESVSVPIINQTIVGQVTYLLLFRFLYYHQEHDLGTLEGTLGDVGIGTLGAQKIVTVHASETVRKALRLMHEHEISGIPVLNDEGLLMDMYCDADVLQLPDLDLDLNVGLALEQARSRSSGPRYCCQIDDPLSKVVACFSTAKTARLACVNKQGVVEGVVTLTDLFKYLAGC
mmetsp:Transcript_96433/g.141028  ORF Transcript_96433/g.141028 Transcript_96433/m.141028 type:complete len:331 (-) Transcript_96433:37-1029(-)